MDKIIFTRQQLYDAVWSEPISSLAKKHNVFDYEIRKACVTLEVPLPKSDYWVKVKWNKKVSFEPLKTDYKGAQEVSISLPSDKKRLTVSEIKEKSLEVPERLTNPDELIIAAKQSLTKKIRRDYQTGILSTDWHEINIRVSEEFISRALLFMDTLIKELRLRKHDVRIKNQETYAIIEETEMKIPLAREFSEALPGLPVSRFCDPMHGKTPVCPNILLWAVKYFPGGFTKSAKKSFGSGGLSNGGRMRLVFIAHQYLQV